MCICMCAHLSRVCACVCARRCVCVCVEVCLVLGTEARQAPAAVREEETRREQTVGVCVSGGVWVWGCGGDGGGVGGCWWGVCVWCVRCVRCVRSIRGSCCGYQLFKFTSSHLYSPGSPGSLPVIWTVLVLLVSR